MTGTERGSSRSYLLSASARGGGGGGKRERGKLLQRKCERNGKDLKLREEKEVEKHTEDCEGRISEEREIRGNQ